MLVEMDPQMSMIPMDLSLVAAKNALPPHWRPAFQNLVGFRNAVRCRTKASPDTIYSDLLAGEYAQDDLVTIGDAWLTDLIRQKAILPFEDPFPYEHLHSLPIPRYNSLCVQLVRSPAQALAAIRSTE